MNCWEYLGIEPTSDQRAIKKAYAVQLKLIDQDIEVEKFIQLREAFEEARYTATYLDSDAAASDFNLTEMTDADRITFSTSNHGDDQHARYSDPDDLIAEDLHRILETKYLDLEQQIVQRYIHLNLRDAILELKTIIMQLDDLFVQQDYIDRIQQLLSAHDLDDFLILLDASDPSDPQPILFDTDLAALDLYQTETEYHQSIDPSLDFIAPTQTFWNVLEELNQALLSHRVDDITFEQFQQLLTQLDQLSISEQISIKDQLQMGLAELDVAVSNPQLQRFLNLWLQYYPEDIDNYNDDYYAHALRAKLLELHQYQSTWSDVEQTDIDSIQLLTGKQKFSPVKMLRLQSNLSKASHQHVMAQIDELHLNQTETNPNYLFLKSMNSWKKFLWAKVIFAMSTYYTLDNLGVATQINFYIVLLLTLAFFSTALSVLHAYLCRGDKVEKHLDRLSLLFFLTGLVLIFFAPNIPPDWHQLLSYAWLLCSLALITSIQLTAQPYMNDLLESIKIAADRWVIICGCISISVFTIWFFYWTGQPNYPWLVYFSLIPLSLLFLPNAFSRMAKQFGSRKVVSRHPIARNCAALLLRCIGLFSFAWFISSDQNDEYIMLGCMSFACLFFTMIDTRWLSVGLKYLSYLFFIIITVYSIVLPFVLIYWAFKSYRVSRETVQLNEI